MGSEPSSFIRPDLKEVPGLFEEIFENAGEAITVFDEDGKYHAFNPAFLRLTGYSRHELLNANLPAVYGLVPDHERPMIAERLKEVLLTGGPVRYERSFLKKEGEPVPARVTLVRLKKRSSWPRHRLLAIVSDISETKAKESELKRMYDVIEQAPVGVLIADEDHRLLYANALLKAMSKHETDRSSLPENSYTACQQFLRTVLCDSPDCPAKAAIRDRSPKSGENVLFGHSKALSVKHLAQPLLDESEAITGLAEYFVDISESKRREKELSLVLSVIQKVAGALQRGAETKIRPALLPEAYKALGQEINATMNAFIDQKRSLLESRTKLEHMNRFLKTVFDTTQGGLMVLLRDGGILMANKTAKELLEDESLPGGDIFAYAKDEALRICQERLFVSGNGGLCPGHEARLVSKSGKCFDVLCRHRPITHPSVFEPCILFSFQDISGFKASLMYLERLLALLPIAYKLDDPQSGLILDANEAFLVMFGYTLKELKSKTWMDLTPERFLRQGLSLAKESLETGEIIWEDKAYIANNGEEIAISHGFTHIYHPGFGKMVALTMTLPKEGPFFTLKKSAALEVVP